MVYIETNLDEIPFRCSLCPFKSFDGEFPTCKILPAINNKQGFCPLRKSEPPRKNLFLRLVGKARKNGAI